MSVSLGLDPDRVASASAYLVSEYTLPTRRAGEPIDQISSHQMKVVNKHVPIHKIFRINQIIPCSSVYF